MVDPPRMLAESEGLASGFLGVRISGQDVRLVVPWVREDWPKVAGQIGRFNAAARFATPR